MDEQPQGMDALGILFGQAGSILGDTEWALIEYIETPFHHGMGGFRFRDWEARSTGTRRAAST